MTDHISIVYVENETKLLWPIEPNADYDKNHIR